MNKPTLYATIALLPVLAYAPLTSAGPDHAQKTTEITRLDEPLGVGDRMISFEIPNAMGGTIILDELLKDGPIVLTFYRGSWCPYCRGELDSIQARLDKLNKAGGRVLAISPEIPSETADLAKQKKLGFLFGTDHDNALAKQLALAFKLDAKTIKVYKNYGINVKESNDTKTWELPIPATYVIDTDRTIKFAFVDEDYTKRADYDKVIKVLRDLDADG
ncbi:MAG: peroxiredoxin-like family protein [Phycisphaerales bacterium]